MIYNLHLVRGLAALAVLVFHTGFEILGVNTMFQAVDVFFVISGFIMAKVAVVEGNSFLWKRIIRIVPLYWLTTVVCFYLFSLGFGYILHTLMALNAVVWDNPREILSWLTGLKWSEWGVSVLYSLLFIPEVVDGKWVYPFIGVGWSLNLEMMFYIFFSSAIFISKKYSSYIVIGMLSALMLIGYFYKQYSGTLTFYSQPYIFQFVAGICAYHMLQAIPDSLLAKRRVPVTTLAVLASCLLIFFGIKPDLMALALGPTANVTQLATPFLFLLSWLMMTKAGLDFKYKPFMLLGDISYAVYLVHMPVIILLQQVEVAMNWTHGSLIMLVITIAISLPLACVLHYYVEVPLAKYLRKRKTLVPVGATPA